MQEQVHWITRTLAAGYLDQSGGVAAGRAAGRLDFRWTQNLVRVYLAHSPVERALMCETESTFCAPLHRFAHRSHTQQPRAAHRF